MWTCLLIMLLASTRVWAAAPTLIIPIAPEATYSVGTYTIAPQTVPTGYTLGYMRLSRAAWPNPSSRVAWDIQLSHDAGSTWTPLALGGVGGGVILHPVTGVPLTYSEVGAPLDQPANTNRRIRATFVVSGGSVTTEVSARLESP